MSCWFCEIPPAFCPNQHAQGSIAEKGGGLPLADIGRMQHGLDPRTWKMRLQLGRRGTMGTPGVSSTPTSTSLAEQRRASGGSPPNPQRRSWPWKRSTPYRSWFGHCSTTHHVMASARVRGSSGIPCVTKADTNDLRVGASLNTKAWRARPRTHECF